MFDKKTPLMSIVIPCWFTENQHGKYGKHETFWFAAECLLKLLERTDREKFELIIIDNGSTLKDADIELLRIERAENERVVNDYKLLPSEFWSKADVLIRNKENLGFGPSCEQGFALASGKYIVCLNNDIIVWKGWEDRLIDILENITLEIPPGISMPALMKETEDANVALAMETIDLKKNYEAIGDHAEFGSLWMMKQSLKKELMEKDGFIFDPKFRLGMGEDRDLWDRVRDLGYETYRTHKTRVFHQGNMTISKVPNRKEYTTENRKYLEEKRLNRAKKTE